MRAVGVVLMLAACGGGEGEGTGGDGFPRACDSSAVADEGSCVLYSGAGWTAGDVEENCTAGTLTPECPLTGAEVGSCTLTPGEFETVTTFYTPYWTGTQAIQDCGEKGGAFAEP